MRCAIFYAPSPSSLLWETGCRWLGRDAFLQKAVKQDRFAAIDTIRMSEITRIPRRYGLHATLKPPFSLAVDYSEEELESALGDFAMEYSPFATSPLVLRQIDDFFCLCPEEPVPMLNDLAVACVQRFDFFREALTAAEILKRRAMLSTESQKHNLSRWGYPYVMDDFRFHITLTDKIIDGTERQIVRSLLTDLFSPVLGKPLIIDAICLFVEPYTGQPLYSSMRFPF